MFQSQGPVAWDAAKEFAKQLATDGEAEPNVEPIDRISIEELTRVAELQVAKITNLDSSQSGKPVKIEVVTRNEWAQETLVAHRDLTELLATQLSAPPTTSADNNLEAQMLGGLFKFLNPMMIAMAAGSMAGHLATHSFGIMAFLFHEAATKFLSLIGTSKNLLTNGHLKSQISGCGFLSTN